MTFAILGLIFLNVFASVLVANYAAAKGHSLGVFVLLGIFLTFLVALAIAYFLPEKTEPSGDPARPKSGDAASEDGAQPAPRPRPDLGPPKKLLEVRNLTVSFETEDGTLTAVKDCSYSVDRGETLGIVGESGSGKSVANLTVMGLTRSPNTKIEGEIFFDGRDLLKAKPEELADVRGN
jgi:ABC-type multidrug transport system fused ATPase/permease subunit